MNTPSVGTISGAPETIAFAGDWHANVLWAQKAIAYAASLGAQHIIHTGDFGYQFHPTFLSRLTETLAAHSLSLWFVDGNHENFDKLYTMPIDLGTGLRRVTPRIFHIPRGMKWMWHGVRFMGVGGAFSIDSSLPHRRRGLSWWPQETLTPAELSIIRGRGPADVLISHDCPAEVVIPGLDKPSSWAPDMLVKAHQHRAKLSRAVSHILPKLIIHGHYHVAYEGVGVGRHAAYDVIGLDKDESTLRSNITILTIEEIKERIRAYDPVDKSERGRGHHYAGPAARVRREGAS